MGEGARACPWPGCPAQVCLECTDYNYLTHRGECVRICPEGYYPQGSDQGGHIRIVKSVVIVSMIIVIEITAVIVTIEFIITVVIVVIIYVMYRASRGLIGLRL